jgi:hypothetical protein
VSQEKPSPPRRVNKALVVARIQRMSVFRQGGMFGPAEVIALAGSCLILLLVVVGYLYFQLPARSRLERLQLERARLQTQLRSSNDLVLHGQTTESAVQSIAQSLDNFESNKLVSSAPGRMSLYQALNAMIRKNGLRNTSGPTYTPLDPAGTKTATGGTKANTKWQSVYPGVAVSVTVEGQYQNLRRFLRDLETTKQFVIINAIELERSSETNQPPQDAAAGGAQNSPVSLRLDMATYFQRPNVSAGTSEQ